MISPVLFYCMAFIVIFGALLMITSNNLVHSAVYMVFTFLGVAGIYATLQLSFFAVLQVTSMWVPSPFWSSSASC